MFQPIVEVVEGVVEAVDEEVVAFGAGDGPSGIYRSFAGETGC